MSRRASLVGVLFLLFAGLAAPLPLASAQTQATVAVTIPSGSGASPSGAPGYSPDVVTVVIGVNNTVVWTNNDSVHHTVNSVSGNGSLSSGDLAPGASFNYTFTSPGTYDYHCLYHSWMAGTVKVLASATPAPEFPFAWLAVILFAVVAAVVVLPRIVSRPPPSQSVGQARPLSPDASGH